MERIRAYVESRLKHIPRYRQRLEYIPWEQHPVWIDDDRFNLGNCRLAGFGPLGKPSGRKSLQAREIGWVLRAAWPAGKLRMPKRGIGVDVAPVHIFPIIDLALPDRVLLLRQCDGRLRV